MRDFMLQTTQTFIERAIEKKKVILCSIPSPASQSMVDFGRKLWESDEDFAAMYEGIYLFNLRRKTVKILSLDISRVS